MAVTDRRAVMAAVRKGLRWTGAPGPALIAHLAGSSGPGAWSPAAFEDPVRWALDVFPPEDLARVLQTPVEDVVRGRRLLDSGDLAAVEEALIAADLGMPAVEAALEVLRERSGEIARGGLPAMRALLREEVRKAMDRPLGVEPFSSRP